MKPLAISPVIIITAFFQIIKVLSAYAADFEVVTSEGDTLLHFAASGGYTDCCRFLAQRGTSIYFKPNRIIKRENGCLLLFYKADCCKFSMTKRISIVK